MQALGNLVVNEVMVALHTIRIYAIEGRIKIVLYDWKY
jgi:hypothetical protein